MWQDWVNIFIGITLTGLSRINGLMESSGRIIIALIFGFAVLLLAGMVSEKRWPEIVNVVAGAFLIVSVFFQFPVEVFQIIFFISGIVISVFALGAALMEPFPENDHEGAHH